MNFLLEDIIYKGLLTEAVKENSIINAIKSKRVIKIYYEGDESTGKGYRSIEIYCYGISTAGNQVIRAFQREGVSATKTGNADAFDNIPSWRLFRIDKISSFVNTIQFHKGDRPKYNPNDKGMGRIIYHL
jgi:hypothetical protein